MESGSRRVGTTHLSELFLTALVLFGCLRPAESSDQKAGQGEGAWVESGTAQAASTPALQGPPFPLDGAWRGSLKIVHRDRPPSGAPDTIDVHLDIAGSAATLYAGNEGSWAAIYPGKLRLETHEESAIVKVMDHGGVQDGKWVETQNVSVTLSSPTVLRAIYVRLVNSVPLPADKDGEAWSLVAVGDLNKVPPGAPIRNGAGQ